MSLRQTAATFAIAVLTTILVMVTIDAFLPEPNYEDYCDIFQKIPYISGNCTIQQTVGERQCFEDGGMPVYDYPDGCQSYRECSFCNQEYENALKSRTNLIFLIIAPLAALLIAFGVYYSVEFIGSGFMYSGILLLIHSTLENFGNLDKFLRILVIFLELCLVLFIAYKKLRK